MLRGDDRREGASRRSCTHASRALRLIAIAALVVVAAIAVGAASRPHSVELSSPAPQLGELGVLLALVFAGAIGLLIGLNPSLLWVPRPDRGAWHLRPPPEGPRDTAPARLD